MEFIVTWLRGFTPLFAVERAHRVPARLPPAGGPTDLFCYDCIIIKTDLILQMARQHPDITVDGSRGFSPDFSAEVMPMR